MTSVIDFLEFKKLTETPTLVLVGLHHRSAHLSDDMQVYDQVLAHCRRALEHARACNIPVAYVRSITPKSASERLCYPAWISGFEPVRTDMVFDVLEPSCYSNTEFVRAMDYSNGNFVIAGLFGDTTCLSTAIDAYHRRHNFTYLSDASACLNNGAIPAPIFHAAVTQVMSIYGKVMEGAKWGLMLSLNRKTQ